jgi:hypothetical protein
VNSKALHDLIGELLNGDPKRRPTVAAILNKAPIKPRVQRLLAAAVRDCPWRNVVTSDPYSFGLSQVATMPPDPTPPLPVSYAGSVADSDGFDDDEDAVDDDTVAEHVAEVVAEESVISVS